MTRVWLPGFAGMLGLLLLACGPSYGADQPATKADTQTKAANTQTKKADKQQHTVQKPVAPQGASSTASMHEAKQGSKTHLPAGFGKVNLSPEQHQQAMAVQEKYAGQIKQLETQIHELKAKREGELNALLSEVQKKSLAEAKANAQKARGEKKAAAKAIAVGNGRFHIDPAEMKAIHEQAEKNLAKMTGNRASAEGQTAAPHKMKMKNKKVSKEETKAPAKEEKTQPKQESKEQPKQPSQPEKK